jgi:hypothetical protein
LTNIEASLAQATAASPAGHKTRGYSPAVGRIGAFLLVVACTGAAGGSAAAAASPKSLRAAILDATSAKHSVHYVVVDTGRDFRTTMVSDAARNRGIQRITVIRSGRTGHVTVLVSRSTVYIRGDAFALHTYMAFPKSQASRYAQRWLSIPHTSPVYASVAADVTFGSFVSHLLPEHQLSIVHSTVAGKNVIGVHGTVREQGISVTEAVFAPTHGTRLPVEATAVVHGPHGGTGRTTMSGWNELVRIHVPAHAIKL